MPSRILIAANDEVLRNILARYMSLLPVVGVACGSATEALRYLASGQRYDLVLAEPMIGQTLHVRYPSATVLGVEPPLNLDELGRRVRQIIGDPVPPELTRPVGSAAVVGSLAAAGYLFGLMR